MNKIERWQKMSKEADKAFPEGFSSPSAQAGVQADNGKVWVAGDHYGIEHVDALNLAHWLMSVCGDEVETKGEG